MRISGGLKRWCGVIIAILFLAASSSITVVDATTGSSGSTTTTSVALATNGNADVLQIIETEVWDAPSNSWKALSVDQRWSNELGQQSLSPSEVHPPADYDFDGDWKIVLTGSDSMGWEYTFQYLQTPKRKRVWLRSLKPKPLPVVPSTTLSKGRRGAISRILSDMKDGYNFKGFSFKLYKSLLSWESVGFAISLPLTTNFELFDRNPALPSISSTFGFYFPWTLTAALSASIHVVWLKWFIKTIMLVIPRLLTLLFYKFALPALWATAATVLLPLGVSVPQIPKLPEITVAGPSYNPDLSERVGCSLSYRWSKKYGFEWRFNYWHSYLPTFNLFRRLLKMDPSSDWWDKHFASLGLSTSGPIPMPPHYSCAAALGLSGLYPSSFKQQSRATLKEETDSQAKVSVSSALRDSLANATVVEEATPLTTAQPLYQKKRSKHVHSQSLIHVSL